MRLGGWRKRDLAMLLCTISYMVFSVHLAAAWALESTAKAAPAPGNKLSNVQFPVTTGTPNPNDILATVNKVRAARELPPLNANASLSAVAHQRLNDMISKQYYAHQSPSGGTYSELLAQQSLSSVHSCENLDLTSSTDSQAIVTDWLTSRSGHLECVLNATDNSAGYATGLMTMLDEKGETKPVYVIVAIGATL